MSVKILVVDDEKDVELLFRQRFRKAIKEGFIELEFAFSGEDALLFLKNPNRPNIALILSDINMPGMSGFELLQKVKSDFPTMKVMMISAYGDNEHQSKAKRLGADDFITKPVNFKELENRLNISASNA